MELRVGRREAYVNGGREAARDRMDVIDGEESEPAGDVYLRDTSVLEPSGEETQERRTSIQLV